jgi:alpha-1,4-digalacturonate transport system substrate-binding protein
VSRLARARATCAAFAFAAAATAAPAAAPQITFEHFNPEGALVAQKFMRENPGTRVAFRQVSFQSLLESLPVQLASGHGPDVSMLADWGSLTEYYLDLRPYVDARYFEREFASILPALRGNDPKSRAINGILGTLTLNGAFVNVTLFQQAGVPLPGPGATWDDWAHASRKVARATRTEMPMEMDRSGHRFASLAISYGAKLVGEDGRFVVDEGLKTAIRKFVAWHRDGTMPMDLWGAIGGATHRDNFADFMNGKVVFYFGGSWSLNNLEAEVGDLFEWAVVDAPCGTSSCTLMPGGGAVAAFRHTREPALAARFMAFLAREDNLREAIARRPAIPVATTLLATGVELPGASEAMKAAIASFTRQVPRIPKEAYAFQGWRFQRAALNSMTTRISQVLTNELTVDRAVAFMRKDVDLAIRAARR